MKTDPTFIERYSLPLFLTLTPLISLAIPFFIPLPPEFVALLIVFVPAIMAVLLTAMTEGGKRVVPLLRKLFQWRIGLKWYAISLGLALVVRLSMSLLAFLLGWIPSIQVNDWSPPQYLIIGIFTLIGAIMEEFGWRGYALPRLLANRSPLSSALIIGIPWGILHLGLTLPGMMNEGTSWVATILFLVGLSVILTWLFIQTQSGIVAGIVYHAAQNYFVFLNGGIGLSDNQWLLTAVTIPIAIILILLFGANLERGPVKKPIMVDMPQVVDR